MHCRPTNELRSDQEHVSQPLRKVPLIDLSWQHRQVESLIQNGIAELFRTQQFILGGPVRQFEEAIAAYIGCRHAIACASGTDALLLSLMAAGIGPGDHVLTTPYSFFATASSIHRLGARPVFCDVDPHTFQLDTAKALELLARDERIRAVLPVHLFGACMDLEPLQRACLERGIVLIEDAAQAIGSSWNGRPAGSLSAMASWSFFPTKNLGAYGDAGMVTTGDAALAQRLAMLRVHGSRVRYLHEEVGINSRLDSLQAVILSAKLTRLDEWNEMRRSNAALYHQLLEPAGYPIRLPAPEAPAVHHTFHQFVITCADREPLRAFLTGQGIATEIYYPTPLHLQPCFAYLGYQPGDLPVSELLATQALALPIYPGLSADDIAYVCHAIGRFYGAR